MKKVLSGILALVMVFALSGCGGNSSKEGSRPGTAYIDECYIEITDCKAQISTYSNQFIAVVWVDFENNSNSARNLLFTASITAYQNGKELSYADWVPAHHGAEDNLSDNIQPGYSISTGIAFVLDDTSAPVVVQICDDSDVISEKIFNL